MPKTVIILGMHRSGTSLVAQYIHKLGVNLGDHLLGKHASNEDGHFEDVDFLNFHRKVLTNRNLGDFLIDDDISLVFDSSEFDKAKKLVESKNDLRKHWGWKDPRTCLFINNWNKIISDSVYIIPYRDPSIVINSVIRRELNNIKEEGKTSFYRFILSIKNRILFHFNRYKLIDKISKTWLIYNNKILAVIKDRPFYLFNIDSVLDRDNDIFSFLKNHGFRVEYFPLESIYKKKLLKQNIDKTLLLKNKFLRKQCQDVFIKLNEISELNN